MWFIYSLTDPRDGRIRYVGKTNNVKQRLCGHVQEALHSRERNHRLNWIRSLVECGQMPQLCILEEGTGDWKVAEKKWIAQFRQAGYELVNATDGGEGVEGWRPSAEHCARISARNKGRVCSPEARARISAALKGRIRSPEARARISAGHKNPSAETRARMSAASRARAAGISASNRRRTLSAETRAKIGAASKTRTHSAETRARMSAASKAYWATRKARSQQCVSAS
jgi:predicted GIY-YIG superfamily endonuclease